MTLTALIVDDELLARRELQYLLEKTGSVSIVAEGSNGIEAVDLIRVHKPDLVFLDVQMPGLDGFAVLKKLIDRKIPLPQVVFATAYDQYAVRAFEVNAFDYLLKPFDLRRVTRTVEKAVSRLATPPEILNASRLDTLLHLLEEQTRTPTSVATTAPPGKVVLRTQSRLLLIDQREICFASIDEGVITVITSHLEGQSNCRTLDELAAQLDAAIFWRTHRSFLVNLNHIREVVPWFNSSYQLRMDDQKKSDVPVSRSQTKRLKEMFNL